MCIINSQDQEALLQEKKVAMYPESLMSVWEELRATFEWPEEELEVDFEIFPQDACGVGVEAADRVVNEIGVQLASVIHGGRSGIYGVTVDCAVVAAGLRRMRSEDGTGSITNQVTRLRTIITMEIIGHTHISEEAQGVLQVQTSVCFASINEEDERECSFSVGCQKTRSNE
jgi:hypothetical protein